MRRETRQMREAKRAADREQQKRRQHQQPSVGPIEDFLQQVPRLLLFVRQPGTDIDTPNARRVVLSEWRNPRLPNLLRRHCLRLRQRSINSDDDDIATLNLGVQGLIKLTQTLLRWKRLKTGSSSCSERSLASISGLHTRVSKQ